VGDAPASPLLYFRNLVGNSLMRTVARLFLFLASLSLTLRAQAPCAGFCPGPAVTQLVDRLLAEVGPQQIWQLTFSNLSSHDARDVARLRQAVETELQRRRIVLPPDTATTGPTLMVPVTLSEDATEDLLVAAPQALLPTPHVLPPVVVSWPRGTPPADLPTVELLVTPLVAQAAPLLDAVVAGDLLLLLEADHVRFLRRDATGQWQEQQSWDIGTGVAPARDPRGRLEWQSGTQFRAWINDTVCAGDVGLAAPPEAPAGMAPAGPRPTGAPGGEAPAGPMRRHLQCQLAAGWPAPTPAGEIGPLRLPRGENAFSAAGLPIPFYNLASLPGNPPAWFFTGEDGGLHWTRPTAAGVLADRGGRIAGTWGSEVAALPACDAASALLLTGSGDTAAPDWLQAYHAEPPRLQAISPRMQLPGPITTLWSDGSTARAIVHNVTTHLYEAYQVRLVCLQTPPPAGGMGAH